MKRRGGPEISAAIINRLAAGPATQAQLCVALGVPSKSCVYLVKPYLMAYRARGWVRIAAWFRGAWPMYEWQSKPHALPDVPQPAKEPGRRRSRPAPVRPPAVVLIPKNPASAFTWGRA